MTDLTGTEIFGVSVVFGGLLALIWTAICAVKLFLPRSRVFEFITDFLFMVFSGFVLFVISTELTGEIRYFTVFGMGVGFLVIRCSVTRAVINISVFITKKCTKLRSYFVKSA